MTRGRRPHGSPQPPAANESRASAPSKVTASRGNPTFFSVPKRTADLKNTYSIGRSFQCPFEICYSVHGQSINSTRFGAPKTKRMYEGNGSLVQRRTLAVNRSQPGGYFCRLRPTCGRG